MCRILLAVIEIEKPPFPIFLLWITDLTIGRPKSWALELYLVVVTTRCCNLVTACRVIAVLISSVRLPPSKPIVQCLQGDSAGFPGMSTRRLYGVVKLATLSHLQLQLALL